MLQFDLCLRDHKTGFCLNKEEISFINKQYEKKPAQQLPEHNQNFRRPQYLFQLYRQNPPENILQKLEDLLKQFMQSSKQNYKNVEASLKNIFNLFFLSFFFS